MGKWVCTIYYHEVEQKFNITTKEYFIANAIHNLQKKKGWCNASRQYLADCFNITKRGVIKMINRLEGLKLIEKDITTCYLRTTKIWDNAIENAKKNIGNSIDLASEYNSPKVMNPVHSSEYSSLPNNHNELVNPIHPPSESNSLQPVNPIHPPSESNSPNNIDYSNKYNIDDNIKDYSNLKISVSEGDFQNEDLEKEKQQKIVVEKEPISEVVEVEILGEEKPKAKTDNPKSPEKKRKEKKVAPKKEKKEEASPSLYNEFKEEYNQFCLRETGTMADWRNGAAYGKALKEVIALLENSAKARNPNYSDSEVKEQALFAWKWVLSPEKWQFLRDTQRSDYLLNPNLIKLRGNLQSIIQIQMNGFGNKRTKEAEKKILDSITADDIFN